MKGNAVIQDDLRILADRAQKCDRAALGELFERHKERLESWIRSHLGERLRGKMDAADLLQETQLRAFESINRFTWRHEDSFYQWLCTIAKHLIWSASQKRSLDEQNLSIDVPKSAPSPSKSMRRNERFDRLERSLKHLNPDERKVIRLSRIEGLRVKEVAEQMGRSEPSVKSLLIRSLKRLRESFGDTESLHASR